VQAPYDQYVNAKHSLLACERNRRVALGKRPYSADSVGIVDPDRWYRVRDRRECHGLTSGRREFSLLLCTATGPRPSIRLRAIRRTYQLIFKGSVRGLAPGASVEFRGIPIGEVTDISAQIDVKTFDFSAPVTISLDPRRLGVKILDLGPGANLDTMRRKLIDALVAHGVRAQLKTGNLLTGSLYVSLDFFPKSPPVNGGTGRRSRRSYRPLRGNWRRLRPASRISSTNSTRCPSKKSAKTYKRR